MVPACTFIKQVYCCPDNVIVTKKPEDAASGFLCDHKMLDNIDRITLLISYVIIAYRIIFVSNIKKYS